MLALVATACGARVSDQARDAAAAAAGLRGGSSGANGSNDFAAGGSGDNSFSGGSGGGSSSGGGKGGSSSGGGSDSFSGASGGGGSSSGGGGSSATGGSGGGSGGGPATTLPPGGNGGATDVGVTGNQILLGNVSTLSGPVPGLFQGAAIGAQAFLAYQNSQGGVFGRQLKLMVRDDGFDAGQNRSETEGLIPKVFGFLGSFSLYDDSGGPAMEKAGTPDVGYGLSAGRAESPVNFNPAPAKPGGWRLGALKYYKQKFPGEITKVGTIVGDIESARASWEGQRAAMESLGYKILYEGKYQPTQTDFTTDVIRMRNEGVEFVMITGADVKSLARFAKAMQQQNFKPKVFATGGIGYDGNLIALAGDSVEGLLNDQQQALYLGEDARTTPEVALFQQWIQRVKPGFKADVFTAFGWASGRLMVEALQKAGPKVTRQGVMAALKGINNFDANGMVAPSGPGTKRPAECWVLTVIKDGKYVRKDSPAKGFRCDGGYFNG